MRTGLVALCVPMLLAACSSFEEPPPPQDDDDTTAVDDDDGTDDDDLADDDDTAKDDDDTAKDDDDTAKDDDDTTTDDDDATEDPLAGLGPGLTWIRTHPMFVSGLAVSMNEAPAAVVDTYFDDFNATSVHTWQDGLPTEVDSWAAAGRSDFAFLSWVISDGTSGDGGAVIGGIGPDAPGRIGFQVGDEPRNMDDLLEIQAGVDAVRAADPDALIVVNFGNPDDGTDLQDLLDWSIANVDLDVVSYDHYSVNYPTYERLEIHRQVALDAELPYWRYLSSFQYADETNWPEPSDMRWNAMVGVVYGYTGHTWFLYQVAPAHGLWTALFDGQGTWSATTNARFDQAADLNAELGVLGEVLVWLTSTDVRFTPSTELYVPDGTTPWSPEAGGDPWITSIEVVGLGPLDFQDVLVGLFEDGDGERYVALQNPTHASADWPVMNNDDADFEIHFDFAGAPASLDPEQLMVLDHHTDAVVMEPLALEGGERVLTVTLDAGDLIFFKYATGAGFMGRP